MFSAKQQFLRFWALWQQLYHERLQWQLSMQPSQAALKQQQVLAEQALAAELKKRSLQLEHELAMLNSTQDAQLTMLKTKCQQDINDYKQYLAALEQLKNAIQQSYTHLPAAVAFTIHHHAKHLLNTMWESTNYDERMRHELQLIRFMTTVHEDARLYASGKTAASLPENTLKLLEDL